MSSPNVKDLLTSFSPSSDFFAIASSDGRIKIWDTLKGQLQTEFADIAASDDALGMRKEAERGHLSLDYKCMKWIQPERKKKKKVGCLLLVLGTGNGDVLALDVALGQLKWKVSDCHPGGVSAISFSGHNSRVYTGGVDGMVCQIDSSSGNIIGKFRSSTKAVSALSVSTDGETLATASAQLKIFSCSNNKKIQKFSGHPVSVRCMIFSEDGKYILSSAVGERYIAIWKIDDGKKHSASCVLSMEHPAVFLDSKGTSSEGAGLYVLAISEQGICYLWYGSSIEALQISKPTKISLSSDSFLSKNNKGLAIFAAKFYGIVRTTSMPVLVAYGALIKPSFEKLMVQYGKDMNLDAPLDGNLLTTSQSYITAKHQAAQTKVVALDRANAEDAVLPLPKLYVHDKKRKHGMPHLIADVEKEAGPGVLDMNKTWPVRTQVHPQKMEEDGLTCVEDRLRAAGILGGTNDRNPIDTTINITLCSGVHFSVDASMPIKKVRSNILSMRPDDAYKLLETLILSWKASRSANPKLVLQWIYYILVIHGQFIVSQQSSKHLLNDLHKIILLRCAVIQPLLKLSGRLQLMMTQIDKAGQSVVQPPSGEHHADHSEDEEDEDDDVDELVYGEEDDVSESGSDDDSVNHQR